MSCAFSFYTHSIYADNIPLEYQLAILDSDAPVKDDDPVIPKYKNLLDELSFKFIESKEQIAHTSFKIKELLKEKGISENMLDIMEAMSHIFPEKIENQKYKEYIAGYAAARMKGMSHVDAAKGLRDIINAIQ
jgi:hypothetical protein